MPTSLSRHSASQSSMLGLLMKIGTFYKLLKIFMNIYKIHVDMSKYLYLFIYICLKKKRESAAYVVDVGHVGEAGDGLVVLGLRQEKPPRHVVPGRRVCVCVCGERECGVRVQ
jgi:hypothetical protein